MKRYKILLVSALAMMLVVSSIGFADMPMAMHDSRAGLPRNLAGQHTMMMTVGYLRSMVHNAANAHEKHREIVDLLGLGHVVAELNLSDEQMQKLIQLNLEHQKVIIRKNAAALEAAAELETLLVYKGVEKSKVSNKVYEIMGAITEIYQDCMETNLTIRGLLTEEQTDIVDENCQCSIQKEKQSHPFMDYFKGRKKTNINKSEMKNMMHEKKGTTMGGAR